MSHKSIKAWLKSDKTIQQKPHQCKKRLKRVMIITKNDCTTYVLTKIEKYFQIQTKECF